MSKAVEVRVGAHRPVELRTASDGTGVLTGYAIVYNSLSQNLGGFVERILPGAADKSLADGVRVLARYNHDDNMLLGTTDAGTLPQVEKPFDFAHISDGIPERISSQVAG